MEKLLLASGALVALVAVAPAMAADQGIRAPAPAYAAPPVSDWTGFYVGGHAGYGWGHDPLNNSLFGQQGSTGPGGLVSNIPPVTLSGIDSKGFVGGRAFRLQSTVG
jgi:outer membrane immunogenic protein